jgi:hypothetical protein
MRRQGKEAKQRKCTMTSTKAVGSDKQVPVISAGYRQWVGLSVISCITFSHDVESSLGEIT